MKVKEAIALMSNMDPDTELKMADGLPVLSMTYYKDKSVCYVSDEMNDAEDNDEPDIYTHPLFRSAIDIRDLEEDQCEKIAELLEESGSTVWGEENKCFDTEDGRFPYLVFDEPHWSLATEWNDGECRDCTLDNFYDFCAKIVDYIGWKKRKTVNRK